MAVCVTTDGSGYLQVDTVTPTNACTEYLLVTSTEYESLVTGSLADISALLSELFKFSIDDFALINGALFLAFVAGNGLGNLVRTLGR